jgi:hypothetical protein
VPHIQLLLLLQVEVEASITQDKGCSPLPELAPASETYPSLLPLTLHLAELGSPLLLPLKQPWQRMASLPLHLTQHPRSFHLPCS